MGSYKNETRSTTVSAAIGDAMSEIETLKDEMEEQRDNMQGTNLEATPKYEAISEVVDELEGLSEPDVPESVADLPVMWVESVQRRKGRGASRQVRLGNCTSMLEAAKAVIEEHVDDEGDDDGDLEPLVGELDDIIDTCGGVSFPGMYG